MLISPPNNIATFSSSEFAGITAYSPILAHPFKACDAWIFFDSGQLSVYVSLDRCLSAVASANRSQRSKRMPPGKVNY